MNEHLKTSAHKRFLIASLAAFALVGIAPGAAARGPEPIIYVLRFPSPDKQIAEVEVTVPTGRRATVEMMMAVWSPGFYRIENYADRVQDFSARTQDGARLEVEARKNRWQIHTMGKPRIVVSYRLICNQRSVTTNWVARDLIVLNGAATFITLADQTRRPHEVRIDLPEHTNRAMTALDPSPDRLANHYRASDYDTLVDSPIVIGNPAVREFEVAGSRHYLADFGDAGKWDGQRAAQDVEKIVRETHRFWGFLPFRRYVFLNVFRQGGGGLEHKDSTLLTSNASRLATPQGYLSWLAFVCHEYFHAFNVKRLRPVELGPFDYENPPRTSGLWVSEGLTTYYGQLIVCRAGLSRPQDFLSWLSSQIEQLQNTPGRLVQTLEQSSLEVWSTPTSGLAQSNSTTTVSYYLKGPIAGFLLDAKIRRATDDRKSLDDVMRLAYRRYSRARGFMAEQFRATAEEVAGVDLREWFRKSISSVEELDYAEALDWYGLRFAAESAKKWMIEIRADSTEAQKNRLRRLLNQ
jgi:predicted metalloprotease with PDZ domain